MTAKKTVFTLGVAQFALPAPRKGSIDVMSGFGRGSQIGVEIHQQVQNSRAREFSNYESEVVIQHQFQREQYEFLISGRIDGFFKATDDSPVKIEEIKSAFNIYDLARRLRETGDDHPFVLQIKTYGYFYWLEHGKIPQLNLLLVSSRNGETYDFSLSLDIPSFEGWLGRRLDELVFEAEAFEKRVKRRKKAAKDFVFPFDHPRMGQKELISTIEDGIKENRPMLIQAPTGLGKTVGVLYPTLKESLTRGQKTIYLTPKNSQHCVAEDAVEKLQNKGAAIKSLTITAKSKLCMKNEPLCNPDFCEYAKDHYTKVAENKLIEEVGRKRSLTAKTFTKMAEKYQVCPFELQLDAAEEADTVICDYNYVFSPYNAFGRIAGGTFQHKGKPNLVIDEAHNMPDRTMSYYSPSISTYTLEKMREEIRVLPRKFRLDAEILLDGCINVVKGSGPKDAKGPMNISAPSHEFLEQDSLLRAFLSTYLKADVNIQPKDVVMRLSFYWSEFTDALEFVNSGRKEFFTTYHPHPATIKITCCDASDMLKDSYNEFAHVVGFSATLKPFEFYSKLAGLNGKNLKTAEFTSPFPSEHRKLLLIPQISSKFSERDRNYPRIAETIERIAQLKRGNYFAFFPSFDFMQRVLGMFSIPDGFEVRVQERHMRKNQIDEIIEGLKQANSAQIVFAVQGGVFSEGVDYPGDMAIGAFIVGPPLPSFDLEREKMREYYEANYSAGFDYAYTYPAMAKAIQAAGRVIRSEKDRGIIILMDNRFARPDYAKSMPQDWFTESPREMVSDKILSDIKDFWQGINL
jgi:DNA excision repair protein ERCC-2